jgi:hypothetical protein
MLPANLPPPTKELGTLAQFTLFSLRGYLLCHEVCCVNKLVSVTEWIPYPVTSERKTHRGLHIKCPLFLYDLNKNWNMCTNFSETLQYKIL